MKGLYVIVDVFGEIIGVALPEDVMVILVMLVTVMLRVWMIASRPMSPVVNFINIKNAAFCRYFCAKKCKAKLVKKSCAKTLLYKKGANKMLVKLSPSGTALRLGSLSNSRINKGCQQQNGDKEKSKYPHCCCCCC